MKSALHGLVQMVLRRYGVRSHVSVGRHFHVGPGSVLWAPSRLTIGHDVYVGKGCTIECDGEIGNNVLIANRVGIVGRHDHDMHAVGVPIRRAPWVGNEPARLSTPVVIGDDVWIGYGAIILGGVSLGRGCVVSAGAVVTHDVDSYAIVAGCPAVVIGQRFKPDEVAAHEAVLYGAPSRSNRDTAKAVTP